MGEQYQTDLNEQDWIKAKSFDGELGNLRKWEMIEKQMPKRKSSAHVNTSSTTKIEINEDDVTKLKTSWNILKESKNM